MAESGEQEQEEAAEQGQEGMIQEEEQVQEDGTGRGKKGQNILVRDKRVVAHGPWRQSSVSPRESKRQQQAARKRDKEERKLGTLRFQVEEEREELSN